MPGYNATRRGICEYCESAPTYALSLMARQRERKGSCHEVKLNAYLTFTVYLTISNTNKLQDKLYVDLKRPNSAILVFLSKNRDRNVRQFLRYLVLPHAFYDPRRSLFLFCDSLHLRLAHASVFMDEYRNNFASSRRKATRFRGLLSNLVKFVATGQFC